MFLSLNLTVELCTLIATLASQYWNYEKKNFVCCACNRPRLRLMWRPLNNKTEHVQI